MKSNPRPTRLATNRHCQGCQHQFYIWVSVHHKSIIYRMSHELTSLLRESVPYI